LTGTVGCEPELFEPERGSNQRSRRIFGSRVRSGGLKDFSLGRMLVITDNAR
jgi:hypothetical protein